MRQIKNVDDIDIIIALGMAKEGFDWPYCEHALTIGYRGSLTEIIQIIGRATRDSSNKNHSQFTIIIVNIFNFAGKQLPSDFQEKNSDE